MTVIRTINEDNNQQKKKALTGSGAPRGCAMNTPFPKWAAGCRSAPRARLVSDCSQAEALSGAARCTSTTVYEAVHAAHADAWLDHRLPSPRITGMWCRTCGAKPQSACAARLGSACVMAGHLYAQRGRHVAALPHVVRHPLQLQRVEASVVEQRHRDGCARLILRSSALTPCRLLQLHNAEKAYLILEPLWHTLARASVDTPCMGLTSGH